MNDHVIGILSEKSGWKADKVLRSPDEAPATGMLIVDTMATVENGEYCCIQLFADEVVVAWYLMERSIAK